ARHFPDLLSRLPMALLCDIQEFPPNVGGDFNSGSWLIRLNRHRPGPAAVEHELGHAAVALRGRDDGTVQGHGIAWMRAMIEAGLQHEAERVSNLDFMIPGTRQAFLQALRMSPNQYGGSVVARNERRPRLEQVCKPIETHDQQVMFVNRVPTLVTTITRRLICQWAEQ
ncbi:MAG: hypothetical protein JWM26_3444, partial [Betaproteobacteria bacterium]|nr:hypothetical protein [Betaproteobacteria bacterium]